MIRRSLARVATPLAAVTLALLAYAAPARALEECRLLRQPDIAGDRIVFVYGGDLWLVGRQGGVATRLTTDDGVERFPKFSPDGSTIAFTAEYDGNFDAFTIATAGGEPKRMTWHPDADMVAEWYPDGQSILLRSLRANRQARRPDRFFKVPAKGGFEEMLPLPYAGYASFSPDGRGLAFVSPAYDNRTWKRYRGGNAPDLWVYDFDRNASQRITDWPGADEWPMWWQRSVYYVSDRGGRVANLWAYDLDARQHRQVTNFTDYDVKWPSLGGNSIVLESGGHLYVLDLPSGTPQRIPVWVPDDKPGTRPERRDVAKWIRGGDLSPSAKRALVEARGEIFSLPAEKGDVRNLTNTPGARERAPAWSPDGRWVAFLSDRTGEYELWVTPADGSGAARQVTRRGGGYPFAPEWSPDSKKLAFSDQTRTLYWCDVASGKVTKVDKSDHGDIDDFTWSGDSRWLAYSRPEKNGFNRILLAPLGGTPTAVSGGMTHDHDPAFDPEGRYLWFLSRRRADLPTFQFEYALYPSESDKLYAATLRADVPSPVGPESDEEKGEEAKKDEGKDGKGKAKDAKEPAVPPLKIDLEGLMSRVAEVPAPWGLYGGLTAYKDRLLWLKLDPPDPEEGGGTATLMMYEFEKRKVVPVISGIQAGYAANKDGTKALYKAEDVLGIVEVAEGKKVGDGKLNATLTALVDPRREWKQMYEEAWRLERDFYYDPAMGGLDWKAVGERYRQLVPYAAHRSDLNYILGEMLGELSTSHAYVGGGDYPPTPQVGVGLLGADWELDAASGRYRFKTLYTESEWNHDARAPLGAPGVAVKPGDVLLQVDGRDVRAPENLYSAFEGTVGRQVRITVGSSANDPKPRTYTVVPAANEFPFRYRAWVKENREKVARATGGRAAYIHLPNTAMGGVEEFTKQYYPQVDREALIVDERWNGGGFIPDFFVERLARRTVAYWSTREGDDFRSPQSAIDGPKCMLINHYAGSGGDALPHYFRLEGLGPLIGTRTWGGLVGISRDLPLMDGGVVTIPDFGMWSPRDGKWEIENHGVDPDIEVEFLPEDGVAGRDPQLDKAIEWINAELAKNPYRKPPRPAYKTQEGLKK